MRQVVIDKGIFQTRIAIIQDDSLLDFRMERNRAVSTVGNIYKGRVVDVIPGMDAAFVDIGFGKNAYLSKLDMVKDGKRGQRQDRLGSLIKSGEEILVQVVKDATGGKGAKVTMRIGLTGKSMVLMPDESHVGISKQIQDEEDKAVLRDWLSMQTLDGYGLIVRTSARQRTPEDLTEELAGLMDQWTQISQYKVLGNAPKCIYSGQGFAVSVVCDEMKNNVNEIVTNDRALHLELEAYLKDNFPDWVQSNVFYKDQVPLFESYKVNAMLLKLTGRRVELSDGAYLIVDETEALTVIDVNSGQNTGTMGIDKTAYRVNSRAAEMVARLMKIREFSGIVLVDFIDMTDEKLGNKLVRHMHSLTEGDRNRVTVHGLTKLGILELTRKKSVESLSMRREGTCPTCTGTGKIESAESGAEALLKDMAYFRHHTESSAVLYEVSEDLHKFLKENGEVVRRAAADMGFNLYTLTGTKSGFKRLRADSEEKLREFTKKTGNLSLNRI